MRILATLLFLAVLVLGIWTFVDAPAHGWWLPENVSSFGPDIDGLFYLILWMVGFFFVLTEGALVWFVFRYSKKDPTKAVFSHGNHRLELVWTAVPALLLLVIAFAQMGTFAEIKFKSHLPPGPPLATVVARSWGRQCFRPSRTSSWPRMQRASEVCSPRCGRAGNRKSTRSLESRTTSRCMQSCRSAGRTGSTAATIASR